MWLIVVVMFVIGFASAIAVPDPWIAWAPVCLFLGYLAFSAVDGTVLYDLLILLIALVPSLLGVLCGVQLSRRTLGTGRTST